MAMHTPPTGAHTAPTVLVVDDEPDIAELMRDYLEAADYAVLLASDGHTALDLLAGAHPIHCVLLDVMLPGISGFDVLRRLRETHDVPVLMLSARHSDSDKLRGLGLGADDYIVKSATPAEVVARVRAVLRRSERADRNHTSRNDAGDGYSASDSDHAATAILDFGRIKLDVRAHELLVDDQPVPCTAREFELLQLLAANPRRVFTRDDLFEKLWGPYGDRHTLTVHISRLREKIELDPAHPQLIKTVWGVGYRFEGERHR